MKFVRFLLFPFAILYHLITAIRNYLFDINVMKSTSFSLPVIVVGNLSVGGTGKTPQIEYLVRILKDQYKIAVLSRGYGRNTKGFLLVDKSNDTKDVGDEPLQYFKKFTGIQVAVDENRVAGIQKLVKLKSPEVILLDDAYQHRKVKGSFYILLTKYDDLFTSDFLLPTGNLRESRAGAERADVILVTKCPSDLSSLEKENIKRKLAKFKKELFFTTISYAENISGSYNFSLKELKKIDVLLVTGIANPNPLLNFLTDNQINFKHLKYPDHHQFSSKNIEEIESEFKSIPSESKIILTTEKDYTRLQNRLAELSYLEIETHFLDDKNEYFNNIILKNIAKYIR